MATGASTLDTPPTKLLIRVAEAVRPAEGTRTSCGFICLQLINSVIVEDPLPENAARQAHDQALTMLQRGFQGLVWDWSTDACGVGFLAGLTEDAFREKAEAFYRQHRAGLVVTEDGVPLGCHLRCLWVPSESEASPRCLVDIAQVVATGDPQEGEGFQFTTLASQDDAMALVGYCVDLNSEQGLKQQGKSSDRRQHKRVPLCARCIVRHFRGGTAVMDAVDGESTNVSRGGLALFVPREMRIGEVIEVELPKKDGRLFAAARVCHCRYISVKRYSIGVTVLETSDEPVFSANPIQAIQVYDWLAEYMQAQAAWAR